MFFRNIFRKLSLATILVLITQFGAARASPYLAVADWKVPLEAGEYEVTQGDQDNCYDTHCRNYRDGTQWTFCSIDLWRADIKDKPVLAPADGKVGIIRYQAVGHGKYLTIVHNDGFASHFAHLRDIYVTEGQPVVQGQVVGCQGKTGSSPRRDWQEHMHFGVFKDGTYNLCVKITEIDGNTNFRIGDTVRSTNILKGSNPCGSSTPITPAPPIPARPTLANPRDGSTVSTNDDVTLAWNSAQNATEYKVETWGNTVRGCDWQGGTSCRIGQLPAGVVRWHVKARNASGQESDWSDGWSLTVQEPPRIIATTPTPTPTTAPIVTTDRDLQIVSGLSLSNTSPRVGESVTASFRIRNTTNRAITIRQMEAGARGPNARSSNWNAPEVDFPGMYALTLQPGQELDYRQSRAFDAPGDYFAEPVWMDAAGNWAGVYPYPRVWFDVAPRQIIITPTPTPTRTPAPPPSPGHVVLIEGLSVSNSNPQPNQAVNARYRVKNDGGSPIFLRYLGVKGRHTSTNSTYDFFWIENLTLQPGQEYTYDANRSFDRTGSYSLTPNYSLDGSNWSDIKFANGSSNYVTINVSAPPPPSPTGNLAPKARREPDGIGSGNAFDGNLSTFWTNGLGHRFNLRLTLQDAATVNRIIVWDRPQNSPDNQQINQLIISLSNGWSKRFDMNSGGPRCIDVTLSSPQMISWVNLKADDASGNNGLSEVEIWAGNKTTGISCSNKGNMP